MRAESGHEQVMHPGAAVPLGVVPGPHGSEPFEPAMLLPGVGADPGDRHEEEQHDDDGNHDVAA